MPTKEIELPISDPNNVPETFATSVVQVGSISGSSVVITLGMRRHLRPDFGSEPQETVCISSRLVLTIDAAQNLVEAVSAVLARASKEGTPVDRKTPEQSPSKTH